MSALASGSLTPAQATSAPFTVAANAPFSVQVNGASAFNPVLLLRSLDGGVSFAPMSLAPSLTTPLQITSDISLDVTESRTGVQYALRAPNPNAPITWQVFQ